MFKYTVPTLTNWVPQARFFHAVAVISTSSAQSNRKHFFPPPFRSVLISMKIKTLKSNPARSPPFHCCAAAVDVGVYFCSLEQSVWRGISNWSMLWWNSLRVEMWKCFIWLVRTRLSSANTRVDTAFMYRGTKKIPQVCGENRWLLQLYSTVIVLWLSSEGQAAG